jgi:lipopolysaccharide export system permease protein
MPILWRYLLVQYFKVFLLCLTTFIAILLTTRLDEIAHFATLGPQGLYILLFTLHQIPYILPIAIPISSLVSAMILIQRLSHSQELTAMRACGFALRDILSPILAAALFLSLLNFYVVSELATASHLNNALLKSELRSVNPLLLLHNKHLMRMKGIFFDALGPSKIGESASNIILAVPKKANGRINLMLARNLQASPLMFSGANVTLMTPFKSHDNNAFDQLIVENVAKATASIDDFSLLLHQKGWHFNNDYLNLPMLLIRLENEMQSYQEALLNQKPSSHLKQIQRSINRCFTEIARRLSLTLAVFSFTLMGLAFGISISRNRSQKKLFFVVSGVVLYLMAFFAAKGIDQLLAASVFMYLVPHLFIIGGSSFMLSRVTRGIE